MTEARQEMNKLLEKDDMPEDTKATMYAQQLQRVNQLKNKVFKTRTISSPNDHTHGTNHNFRIRQCYSFSTQVIPSHGNPQTRRTLFVGYLFKYCSVKYQTFDQVSEKTSQQTYSHQNAT